MQKVYDRINWENYPSDSTPINETNLNKIDYSVDEMDRRIVQLDSSKASKTEVAYTVVGVGFDESTGTFQFQRKNGTTFEINTALEKIATNFEYDYNTQKIKLTLIDGTVQEIDLSDLITQYEFKDSDTISFDIDSDGKVSAKIIDGSITEDMIEADFLADLKVDVDEAKGYADSALAAADLANKSANTAATKATEASEYASAAADSADNANASATDAEDYKNQAKESYSKANDCRILAKKSANTAADSATNAVSSASAAAQYATTASEKATAAATSATSASNYAIGSTNSAKYYYEQAKSISESFAGALRPKGTVMFANLPSVSSAAEGDMYNISNQFTTTSDFKEGSGSVIPAGANVYKTSDGYWDILAGTPVTGVKGNEESTYRQGNVNITPENIGALPLTGGTMTGELKSSKNISTTGELYGDRLYADQIYSRTFKASGANFVNSVVTTLNSRVIFGDIGTSTVIFSRNSNDVIHEYYDNSGNAVRYTILDAGNYTSYVPTKTGNGASGTWGIDISGDAATVNGHTVNSDVPSNAKFTDTTYSAATTSVPGLMSTSDKSSLNKILTDALKLKYIWYANKDAVAEISNPLKKIGTISSYKEFGNVFVVMYASAIVSTVVTPGTASTVTPSTKVGGYTLFNNGDLLAYGGKYAGTEMWKRIPMYEAKTNLDGLMSAWDKTQVNKIPSIESSISSINSALPSKMPIYTDNEGVQGNWLVNWLFNDGWYLGGITADCDGHPPILNGNGTSWAILVLNGMNTGDGNYNHRLQVAFDLVNSKIYMRRGWISARTWADAWTDVAGTDTYAPIANPVFTGSISLGRKADSTVGDYSITSGNSVTASGLGASAGGVFSVASGAWASAKGYGTTASGYCSSSEGQATIALAYQHAQGHYNDTSLATAYTNSGASDGTAFVIGNGTNAARSNAFRVTGKGVVYAKSNYNATGADYAEFAEWADGNSNNEDRRGYFVTYDEEKQTMIRIANEGEYILGIVSANPCVIGNSDEGWIGRYVFDEFGSIVYEEREEEIEYIDEDTGEAKTKKEIITTYKLNPDYDPEKQYVHRKDRKEWAAVGWIGVLAVRDDGTCVAGGYCKVADGGIATYSERSFDTYRVLERVTDNIIKVALK